MTPARFKECQRAIGWTINEISRRAHKEATMVRRWSKGIYPVPPKIAEWLEGTAAAVQSVPQPPDERRGR